MRNLIDVIDEMVEHIPEERTSFIQGMERIREDQLKWTAPESNVRWEEVAELLSYETLSTKPTEDWKFKVQSIWTCRPIEDLKEAADKLEKEGWFE